MHPCGPQRTFPLSQGSAADRDIGEVRGVYLGEGRVIGMYI